MSGDDPAAASAGERRRRRLEERLAAEEAAGVAPSQLEVTRRRLREAERAVAQAPAEDGAAKAPPPSPPAAGGSSRPGPRPLIRPPAGARRPGDPLSSPSRTAPRGSRDPAAARSPAPPVGPSLLPQRPPRRRARWRLIAATVLIGLLVAVAGYAVLAPGEGRDDEPGPAAAPAQRTLAFALVDGADDVTGAALLGTDGDTSSALLVPSRLVVDVAGGGRVPLMDAVDTGDAAVGQALEDVLDVRVDAGWVLTAQGLAKLVDDLDGISVDVQSPVTTRTLTVPAGDDQRLDGAQAVAYALHLAPGEPEPARSARLSQVVTSVLQAMPTSPEDVEALLSSLSGGSRTTVAVPELASVLADLSSTAQTGDLGASVLPVREIPTGAETTLYGLDDAAAAAVLEDRFAGALRPGGVDAVRVLVQNGVGTPGLGEQARSRLVAADFRFVGGGNATTLGRPTTVVAVPSDSEADRARGVAVAEALGLPPTVVAVGQDAPTLADVVVVLGEDFAAEVAGTS